MLGFGFGIGAGDVHRPRIILESRRPELLNMHIFPFRCSASEYNCPYPRKTLWTLRARKKSSRAAQNVVSQLPLYRKSRTVQTWVYDVARAEIYPYAHHTTGPKVGRWRHELGRAAPPVHTNWNPPPCSDSVLCTSLPPNPPLETHPARSVVPYRDSGNMPRVSLK